MSGQPDPYSVAYLAKDFCLAESPDGYLCSEEPGHDGWHRAESVEGELFDTWPGDPE